MSRIVRVPKDGVDLIQDPQYRRPPVGDDRHESVDEGTVVNDCTPVHSTKWPVQESVLDKEFVVKKNFLISIITFCVHLSRPISFDHGINVSQLDKSLHWTPRPVGPARGATTGRKGTQGGEISVAQTFRTCVTVRFSQRLTTLTYTLSTSPTGV